MSAYTVYLDQVFLGNLVMNYAILWSAAKLGRTPASRWRLAAGAALGSVYSLALFFPADSFLMTVWFKAAASLAITAAVFAPVSLCKFLTCLGCFYLCSFALGGLTLGLIFFSHTSRLTGYGSLGGIIAEHFWSGILLGLASFYAAAKGIAAIIRSGCLENLFSMCLTIKSGGGLVKVDAFLDTGNHLKDPMTRHPVIVAEYAVLKPLLPEEARNCFERDGEPDVWGFLGSLSGKSYASRFTAVPFQSLGNVNGLLVGFRPDEVLIESKGKQIRVGKAVIAIYHKKLDPGGGYHALLSSDLMTPLS